MAPGWPTPTWSSWRWRSSTSELAGVTGTNSCRPLLCLRDSGKCHAAFTPDVMRKGMHANKVCMEPLRWNLLDVATIRAVLDVLLTL
jgi:hypothetical protein